MKIAYFFSPAFFSLGYLHKESEEGEWAKQISIYKNIPSDL